MASGGWIQILTWKYSPFLPGYCPDDLSLHRGSVFCLSVLSCVCLLSAQECVISVCCVVVPKRKAYVLPALEGVVEIVRLPL